VSGGQQAAQRLLVQAQGMLDLLQVSVRQHWVSGWTVWGGLTEPPQWLLLVKDIKFPLTARQICNTLQHWTD